MSLEHVTPESVDNPESVRDLLNLAMRLKGGDSGLDDDMILALSELSGHSPDILKMASRSQVVSPRASFFDRLKAQYHSFDPSMRRYVAAVVFGLMAGAFAAASMPFGDSSGFIGALSTLSWIGAIWNCAQARNIRVGIGAGTITGTVAFLMFTATIFVINLMPTLSVRGLPGPLLMVMAAGGAALGGLVQAGATAFRRRLGLKDPASQRRELLEKLLAIQEELKAVERYVTFVSVDVVGSTRIKKESDTLSAEYSFNEYHQFIETLTRRHGGRVHSTAGDGVTAAFDTPENAFRASRAMLAGLFEFNAFRNKTGHDFDLRIGIHTGTVMAPDQDVKQVNFASVIDIAAHMQKCAPNGTLAISEVSVSGMPPGEYGLTDEQVDCNGMTGYIWRPRRVDAPIAKAATEALPEKI
ncbi:MAG: adenylate/guanylate cyclase domain-containing protein [Fimbriimonadaceae bacterium]|nr:adenylate/guanylate cyclase domain-containing protein [Fimbriimonadaceae bacterium]